MTLAPLIDAPPVIRFHAFFAFAAIGLGAVQLLAPKGTLTASGDRLGLGDSR